MLNWSHFKPEFSGKPEDDAEAHLPRTNDWMETHYFPEAVKLQRFCLTLAGEVRLWYESLRPKMIGWQGLKDRFRQQYSKIGNTCEQLFHVWRSFHCDEITEMLDVYVTRIKQVAGLLGYGEPQILEVFKNILPNRLYWVLFPIEDLRLAVETVKRILTKEKIGRQLLGQSTGSTPFMKVSDTHKLSSSKTAVSFNMSERTDDKIDKLTSLVSKMNVKMDKCDAQLKPQTYQRKRRGQNRCTDTQNDYWTRNRLFIKDRDISYRGRGRFSQNYSQNYRGRPQDNFRNDYRRGNYREQRYRHRGRSRDNCRDAYRDSSRDDHS